MDIFNIILLKTYLEKYNFLKYEKRKINNYNEMIQYLNKNKKIYDNVFRIIIFDSLKESEIKFRIENEQYFSFMLDNKDFEKNFDDFKKKFEQIIFNYFSNKIKNFVNKNFLYYSTDKECLNRNNLKDKLIYDLKKLNYSITYKKIENNEFNNEIFNENLTQFKSIKLDKRIKLLYENCIDEDTRKILNLNEEHFKCIDKHKDEILEEYLCWGVYKYFFCEYLVKKICKN